MLLERLQLLLKDATQEVPVTGSSSLINSSPFPKPTHCDTSSSTPVSTSSVISASSVVAASSLCLPGPSSVTTSHMDGLSSQEDQVNCECPFCFKTYCHDGKEWLECACGRWIHEQCIEEVILDSGGHERFCPFCLN